MLKVNRINPTSQQKGPLFGTLKTLAFITIVNVNFLNTSITVNHLISKDCLQSTQFYLLNIGYVSNETNEDVRMYIEEFILIEIWIHCCTKLKS